MGSLTWRTRQKSILLLIFAVFVFLYIVAKVIERDLSTNISKREHVSIYGRKGKVLILISAQRSGSSFVGEFFNRFLDGYYLFEPLLMFTPSCDKLQKERLDVLKNISHCDFRELVPNYKFAKKVMNVNEHSECIKHHMCFSNNHPVLLRRYSELCNSLVENYGGFASMRQLQNPKAISDEVKHDAEFSPKDGQCGFPVNLTLMSSLCRSAQLVSYKIVRVCSISAMEDMMRELSDMGSTVYVVELVRDPRAILSSLMGVIKVKDLEPHIDYLCGRYRSNTQHVEEKNKGIITNGRYMRVRYEDIVMDPVKGAESIYSFVGMSLPPEVRQWIEETSINPEQKIKELKNTISKGNLGREEETKLIEKITLLSMEMKSSYGTARNPKVVLMKWRKTLSMTAVNQIQEKCGDVMEKLGYKLINSEQEKGNEDLQLW